MPTIESTNTILEAPQFGKTISMKMFLLITVLFTAAFSILACFLVIPPRQTQVGIDESTTQASQAEESTNRNQPPAKVEQAAIPEVSDSVVQSIKSRKLTVRTLDSETESPIGGVVVRFMQGELGLYVDSNNRYLVTDDKGEASTELSSPNVQIYLSFIPPGYVCTSGAVTVPLSNKNSDEYVMPLTKGTVWQVEAATHNSDASLAQIPFKWMIFASSNKSVANNAMPALSGFPELQVGACSKLTIPKDSVRFTAQVFHDFMGFSSGGSGLALTIEQVPGFDPNHVIKINNENDRVKLTDSSSRHAFVNHADVKVDNNRATVSVQIAQPQDTLIRLISGRVIDEKGQPIRDASVMLRSDSAGAYGTLCTTNSEGKISSTPLLLAAKSDYEIEVRKRGYKVINKPLSDANRSQEMQSIDAGSIVLEVGASGKVELMDQHSKPISQASVVLCDERRGQPYADFVTDDTGGVEVSGLFAGKTQVLITAAGYEPIRSEIDAAKVDGNLWRITLLKPTEVRSKSKDLAAESPVVTNPSSKDLSYKKGDSAFPLKTRLWVDEQGRELSADTSLASFKGRAVFLLFTGKWCSACENAKPIYRKLRAEFDSKDVAFVALHTPEINDEDFKKWILDQKWFHYAAIDQSSEGSASIQDGDSANIYQVIGYPTVVILDRAGRIHYSDNLQQREMTTETREQVITDTARELGIKLPLDSLSEDERKSAYLKISTQVLSKYLLEACNGNRTDLPN